MSTAATLQGTGTLNGLWRWARLTWRSAPIGVCGVLFIAAIGGATTTLLNFSAVPNLARLQNALFILPPMFALMQFLVGLLVCSSLVRALRYGGLRLAPGLQHTARAWLALSFVLSWAAMQGPLAWVAMRHSMGWPVMWSLGLAATAWAASLRILISPSWWRWLVVWPLALYGANLALNLFDRSGLLDNAPDWFLNFLATDVSYWLNNPTWSTKVLAWPPMPWLLAGVGALALSWAWRATRADLHVGLSPVRSSDLQHFNAARWAQPAGSAGAARNTPRPANLRALLLSGPPPSHWDRVKAMLLAAIPVGAMAAMLMGQRQALAATLAPALVIFVVVELLVLTPWSLEARLSPYGLLVPGGVARQTAASTLTWQQLRHGAASGATLGSAAITVCILALGLPLYSAAPLAISWCAVWVAHCTICVALIPLLKSEMTRVRICAALLGVSLLVGSHLAATRWFSALPPLAPTVLWAQAEFLWASALLLLWLLPRLTARAWARRDWVRGVG